MKIPGILTPIYYYSCAKAFDNRSRSKNLKPNKIEGGGVNLTPPFPPPPPLKASRVNTSAKNNKFFDGPLFYYGTYWPND